MKEFDDAKPKSPCRDPEVRNTLKPKSSSDGADGIACGDDAHSPKRHKTKSWVRKILDSVRDDPEHRRLPMPMYGDSDEDDDNESDSDDDEGCTDDSDEDESDGDESCSEDSAEDESDETDTDDERYARFVVNCAEARAAGIIP